MTEHPSTTCLILGEGSLPIQCLESLRKRGFQVLAFVSRDEQLLSQAAAYSFPFVRFVSQLDEGIRPDYIFSINNGIILKPAFIQKATKLVVNYHDSPLPKYAGMYAPNWALFNGETKHAVSWHVLNEGIDTGDILEQEFVDIEPSEPVWSVNIKCFEAALLSFERLLDAILDEQMVHTPQNESERTYYPLMARPLHLGMLTSECNCSELERLQQVTNYGLNNDNEFLLPHMALGAEFLTVPDFELQTRKQVDAGLIVYENDRWGFCCQDGIVFPGLVYDKKNQALDFGEALSRCQLAAGQRLPIPDLEKIDLLFADHCKQEFFWKQERSKVEMLPYPFVRNKPKSAKRVQLNHQLSDFASIKSSYPVQDAEMILLGLISAFLMRINDQDSGTIGYIPKSLPETIKGSESLFSLELPLNLSYRVGAEASVFLNDNLKSLEKCKNSGTFTIDLALRYPALKPMASEEYACILCHELPTAANMQERSLYLSVMEDQLILSLPDDGYECGARQFLSALPVFIRAFLAEPTTRLFDLPLLEPSQAEILQATLNPSPSLGSQPSGVIDLFDALVATMGDKPALFDGRTFHSYRQFQSDTLKVASVLGSRGVKPNDVVMLCLPRSYWFFVAQWATLRCRAAFLPIDSSMPDDRKRFIFEDSQTVLVVADEVSTAVFPKEKTLCLTEIPPVEDFSKLQAEPTDLAYLIYTSGSTGVPKGVRISNGALSHFVASASETYGFSSDERVLQFSNLGFDASIEEVFCTLCVGGTLYLRSEEMLDPDILLDYTLQHDLTVWDFPTAFWRQIIAATTDRTFPTSIRAVIIGGEAVTNSDFETWKQHPSSRSRLFNTYGPTETTVVATVFEITTDFEMRTSVPIGRPLAGYRAFITDKHRNTVPAYLPGELLIAGSAVADGYLNRAEVQEKVFVSLAKPSPQRCYCTGDLVFCDEAGLIHYIGRADGQLKIRGFRVEPGEIENQIMQLGGVQQCIVLGKANDKGEKQLVAFFVPQSPATNQGERLKAACHQVLPNYMVPDYFLEVTEIPMTPNGKIDKKSLLALPIASKKKRKETASEETRSPLQEQVTQLWRRILEDPSLGLDDDFFENGGHSLRAVRLMAELKKEFGKHLPLSSLISYPTPRGMATLLDSENADALWNCLVPIRKKGSKMPLYLIHGAGLNVLLYQSLGNHLDPDRPIFALQAKGLDGKSALSTSIEEMASDYVKEIRMNQPEGPYAIFGFSLGGFIAFEMARQLTQQGQKVAFLGVIDTVTSFANEELPRMVRLKRRIKAVFGKPAFLMYAFFRESNSGKSKFVRQKIKNAKGMLYYYASRAGLIKFDDKPSVDPTNNQPIYLSSKASVVIDTALSNYTLKPTELTVDLFRAGKQMFYIEEPETYGWSRYALQGVVVENVPGEHSELFAPPNDTLFAKLLTDRLNEVEESKS